MSAPTAPSTPAAESSPRHGPSQTLNIPGVFDAAFFNSPDIHSVLVHAISSSTDQDGFQAIVCFHSHPDLPSHLGLPTITNYEDKAFLQTSSEHQPFVLQNQAPRHRVMQVTVMEYLILLQFVGNEWPRLQSKLQSQLITMRKGTDPIYISGHLVFYNHGSSHFRVSISSRLTFKACIESRDPENNIKAWLERRSDSMESTHQELELPMNALLLLTQDVHGYKALVDQMSAYKSRSRKRNKAVLS